MRASVLSHNYYVTRNTFSMSLMRTFKDEDWPATWRILEPVFRAGESYPYSPDITEKNAYKAWIETPSATYVAIDEGNEIIGTYYIRPNQPALGSHVCNCGYIVSEDARGKGTASEMCEHSQHEAIRLGFKSMQYNLVVSTNKIAVHIWKKNGFELIGTLPGAFQHRQLGFVDAFVMYKELKT